MHKKGEQGEQGEIGPQGIQGEQGEIGDEPAHEWSGTQLRFQNPDESWGNFVDLKGETGATTSMAIYGCVWDKTPTSIGTRIGACKNFVANIGIDDQLVINDFDSAPIFGELKEVTDMLGNEFVRIPKFYIRKRSEAGWLSKEVSKYQYDGFYLPKIFWDFDNLQELDYFYYGKYNAGLDGSNRLTSKAGVNPLILKNIVDFRTYAEASNAGGLLGYQQLDIHAYDALVTLMQIEFATLDMQSVMQGFTAGQYLAGHTLTADTNPAGNALVVANATGALYRVGQSIGVGTALGENQRFYGRVITQIDVDTPSAGSTTITFDGDVVALTTGNILYNVGWRSGFSYDIAASSGCIEANDGKYPCMYRGIENPYGNVGQWVDGVNITARQAWVCDDADDYASNLFAAPYKQLSYVNANTNNYVKEMGFDVNNPFAEFPESVDVVGNSPYKDYYYQNTADYVAFVGGFWNIISNAGSSSWHLGITSSSTFVSIGGRLLKKSI